MAFSVEMVSATGLMKKAFCYACVFHQQNLGHSDVCEQRTV